jgi:hypothetical protein
MSSTKGCGIKIKNPLSLPVRVVIKSDTGALRTGDGTETWRKIDAGAEINISLKGQCELDITATVLKYRPDGNEERLGEVDLRHVHHRARASKRVKKKLEAVDTYQGSSRSWTEVVSWQAENGMVGWLDNVNVTSPLYGFADFKVVLGKKVLYGPASLMAESTVRSAEFLGTQEVKVLVMSRDGGEIDVTAKLNLRQELAHTLGVPDIEATDEEGAGEEMIPDNLKRPPEEREEEEVSIRSLGDMIEEIRQEEVKV